VTLRSFRKRPPFVFTNDARPINLPCDPKITQRGTAYYPEFHMFPGPEALGVTGDNSLRSLIGRTWAILFCDNNDFYLLQWDGSGWVEREDSLLPVPEFVGTERRFTAAFDQSARLVYAYESAGVIRVTRWDTGTNAYVQNVTVAGVDPVVAFDATWAYDVPVSDVLLFYLSANRTKLMCRVQRDLYLTEYELFDYEQAVILDRVTRLPLQYQVLSSDAVGDPLQESASRIALLSAFYPYPASDVLLADIASVPAWTHTKQIVIETTTDGITSALPTVTWVHTRTLAVIEEQDGVTSDLEGLTWVHTLVLVVYGQEEDGVTGDLSGVEDWVHTRVLAIADALPDGVTGSMSSAQPDWVHKEA